MGAGEREERERMRTGERTINRERRIDGKRGEREIERE